MTTPFLLCIGGFDTPEDRAAWLLLWRGQAAERGESATCHFDERGKVARFIYEPMEVAG